MEKIQLNSYVKDKTLKHIQKLLWDAYQITTCMNGPFPEPEDREKVFELYSNLFSHLVNKKL